MRLRAKLKKALEPNYYRLHWLYIVIVTLLGATGVYFIEGTFTFIDAFVASASSVAGCGLASVDVAVFQWTSQVILMLVMVFGSPILMTLIPVYFRRRIFRQRFNKSQRQHLVEYKVLRSLFRIVILYFVVNHVVCTAVLTLWAAFGPASDLFVSANKSTIQFGAFVTFTGFANAGFTTFSDNLMSFARYPFPLLVAVYLTLAGNTGFPLMLRLIVWVLLKISGPQERQVYEHLLKYPRRYFTHLFLARQTWWLLVTLVIINSLQFLAVLGLDWNSRAVEGFTPGDKVLNFFFHSFVTRSSGFSSLDISLLTPASLLLYTAAMYISSTPVVVTVRTTDEDSPEIEEEMEDTKQAEVDGEEALQIEPAEGEGEGEEGEDGGRRQRHSGEAGMEMEGEMDEDEGIPHTIKLKDMDGPSVLSTEALRHHNEVYDRNGNPFGDDPFGEDPASHSDPLGENSVRLSDPFGETSVRFGDPMTEMSVRSTLGLLEPGKEAASHQQGFGAFGVLGQKITETWNAGMETKVGQTLHTTGQKIKTGWETNIAPKITETWQAGMDTKVGQTLHTTGQKIKTEWDSTIAPKITETWHAGMESKVGQTLKTTWDVGVARPLKKITRKSWLQQVDDDAQDPYRETLDDNLSIENEGPLLVIPKPNQRVRTQTKLLLTQDTMILFTILFLICYMERDHLIENPRDWSIFKVIFEIASGYGTCGLSLGFPGYSSSFCSVWHPFCKVLIGIVMLMGRHRGLPTSIDRAIQLNIMEELPSQFLPRVEGDEKKKEEEDAKKAEEEAKLKKEQERERRAELKKLSKMKKGARDNLKLQLREHQNTMKNLGLTPAVPARKDPAAMKEEKMEDVVIDVEVDSSSSEEEIPYSKLAGDEPSTPVGGEKQKKQKQKQKQELVVAGEDDEEHPERSKDGAAAVEGGNGSKGVVTGQLVDPGSWPEWEPSQPRGLEAN